MKIYMSDTTAKVNIRPNLKLLPRIVQAPVPQPPLAARETERETGIHKQELGSHKVETTPGNVESEKELNKETLVEVTQEEKDLLFKPLFNHKALADQSLVELDWATIMEKCKAKVRVFVNTDPNCSGPHIFVKEGERPQVKWTATNKIYDKTVNQWLFLNEHNIHPDMIEMRMVATCSAGKECRNHKHSRFTKYVLIDTTEKEAETNSDPTDVNTSDTSTHVDSHKTSECESECCQEKKLPAKNSSSEFTEHDWDIIKKYIQLNTKKTEDGKHTLWTGKGGTDPVKTHKGINKPITHWLVLLGTRENPRTSEMRLIRQCDEELCINIECHCDKYDEDAIFIINAKKLRNNTRQVGECLIWTGTYRGKYGQTNFNGVCTTAHKMAYLIHNRIFEVDEGLHIAHNCGTAGCTLEDHLRADTPKGNMADKKLHGTDPSGERNPMAVLNSTQVLEIFTSSARTSFLADKYGVSMGTIQSIRNGTSWSTVTGIERRIKAPEIKRYITPDTPDSFYTMALERLKARTVEVFKQDWNTPCWCCTKLNDKGYGEFSMLGRSIEAHRAAFMLKTKKEVPEGLVVRHKCDIPSCCNPEHLEDGTPQDNANDRKRNNTNFGPNRQTPRETMEKVIKKVYNTEEPPSKIARDLGVTINVVRSVIDRGHWNDVKVNLREAGEIVERDLTTKVYTAHNRKLTEEIAREVILEIIKNKETPSQIAARFGIDKGVVNDIKRKKAYKALYDTVLSERQAIQDIKPANEQKAVLQRPLKLPTIINRSLMPKQV
jgi:hypothetical protein